MYTSTVLRSIPPSENLVVVPCLYKGDIFTTVLICDSEETHTRNNATHWWGTADAVQFCHTGRHPPWPYRSGLVSHSRASSGPWRHPVLSCRTSPPGLAWAWKWLPVVGTVLWGRRRHTFLLTTTKWNVKWRLEMQTPREMSCNVIIRQKSISRRVP